MRVLYIIFIISVTALHSAAQSINYKFRIRYNDYSPLASGNFIISGESLTTDPQGIISMGISPSITYVNIGSANVKLYEIRYPQEGKATLPKDPSIFVDIFIAKPAPDPLKTISAQIAKSQSIFQSAALRQLDAASKKGYNEIVELLNTKNMGDSTLEKGRLEFFPLISAALNNYVNESKNFIDAFTILSTTLNNKDSYDQLNKVTADYNEIFDLLNANKSAYEQAIATYWSSKELSLKFSNLVDFALEDFHKPYILDVNYSFTPRMYSALAETNKNKRADLQKSLATDMNTAADAMTRRINELGERVASINTLLNNNERIDN